MVTKTDAVVVQLLLPLIIYLLHQDVVIKPLHVVVVLQLLVAIHVLTIVVKKEAILVSLNAIKAVVADVDVVDNYLPQV